MKGYLVGETFAQQLKTTIARVDGMAASSGATAIPTRFDDGFSYAPKPIRIAAYPRDTFWRKNEVQQVTFYTHNGTQYGLATLDASGTATAVNICNDLPPVPTGIDDPRLGPTPTMTWCVTSASKGGANVVVDGPQAGTFVAAYPTSGGEWGTGQTRTVAYYYRNNTTGAYQPTGFTASAVNVGSPYKLLSAGGNSGPTPTMAWCVVATAPDGGLVAVEAQAAPEVQWATINPNAIGEPWQRTSSRTVSLPGGAETADVVSVFNNYSPLDLPNGLAFIRGVSPNGGGTANVVIGPSPIPIHSARYQGGSEWQRNDTRQLTVLPSADITQQRSVVVSNPYYDSIDPTSQPMAIGKVGTAYHVITAPPQSGAKLGTRTEFGDKDSPWQRTSERFVKVTGTTSEVKVVSVFDHYSHLDVPFGLVYTKSKDPRGGDGTANVVIAPPPIPIHSAKPQQAGSWARDEQKVLDVLQSQGITQSRTVNVSNPYFDDVEIDPSQPMAIGKVGTAYHVITAPPQSGVKLGTRVIDTYLEDWDSPWPQNASRTVRITGTTTTVQVLNVFDHYSHLDVPHGLAFVKTKDGSGGTTNVLISPPPVPLHSVRTTETGTWAKGQGKLLIAPPTAPGGEDRAVNVSNPYFDDVALDPNNPMVIGKFGTAYHLITSPGQPGVTFAERSDSGQWEKGSQRQVRVFGRTTTVDAYNFAGHYESFDGRGTGGLPGLALGKGPDLSGGAGTAFYVISPSPITFRTGTFSGQWAKGSSKSITLSSSPTGTITVINNFGSVGATTGNATLKCAMSKEGSQWYLIAAECA